MPVEIQNKSKKIQKHGTKKSDINSVSDAKSKVKYILLLIDSHQPMIYMGSRNNLQKVEIKGMPNAIEDMGRDYSSKVANFSDNSNIKEIKLEKFLREIDNALTGQVKLSNLPIIVCGVKRSIGHFKKLTKNEKKIVEYVERDYNHGAPEKILDAIEPVVSKILKKPLI